MNFFQTKISKLYSIHFYPIFFAITLTLVGILSANQVFLVFRESLNSPFTLTEIFYVVFLKNIRDLNILLPVSFFFASVVALSRLKKNSELIIMGSAGIRGALVLNIISRHIYIFLITIFCIVFFISPIANKEIENLKIQVSNDETRLNFTSENFINFNDSKFTIYIDNVRNKELTENQLLENIYFFSENDGSRVIIFAKKGIKKIRNNYLFFELFDGKKYIYQNAKNTALISNFKKLLLNISSNKSIENEIEKKDLLSLNFIDFLQINSFSGESYSELFWRIGLTVSIIYLALIAFTNINLSARNNRDLYFIKSIVLFIIYFYSLLLIKSLIEKNVIENFSTALIFLTLPALIIIIYSKMRAI